jgi:dihydrofolate reductase
MNDDHDHSKKIPAMRRLIESTLVSLDGVIESPDRWANFDEEAVRLALHELDGYDAFVMGRETYERFRTLWGSGGNPYTDKINAMPKYVASRSLTEVTWNATLLGPDIVAEIERLKGQPGKDLIKYGTSRLDATLFDAGLVDELRLWIFPVVIGSGQRLFEGIDPSKLHLELGDVRKLDNGSAILTYLPRTAGRECPLDPAGEEALGAPESY